VVDVGAGTWFTLFLASLVLRLTSRKVPARRMTTPHRRAAMMSLRVLTAATVAIEPGKPTFRREKVCAQRYVLPTVRRGL